MPVYLALSALYLAGPVYLAEPVYLALSALYLAALVYLALLAALVPALALLAALVPALAVCFEQIPKKIANATDTPEITVQLLQDAQAHAEQQLLAEDPPPLRLEPEELPPSKREP